MTDEELAPVTQALADRVDETIRNTIAEHGGLPDGAITVVSYIDDEGEPSFAFVSTPGQRKVTTIGLVRFAQLLVEQQILEGS